MDIQISTLERAICDAIALLCRTRLQSGMPFYLMKPLHPLRVTVKELDQTRCATVMVECKTWGDGSHVMLRLQEHNGNWTAWGPFSIRYSVVYPVAVLSARSSVGDRDIYPMYWSQPDALHHMQLRVRRRQRPGR